MNWKEHANLFANGKFHGKVTYVNGQEQTGKIVGYYADSDRGEAFCFEETYMPISHCTLIARPISDMTDDELEEAFHCSYEEGIDVNWILDQLKNEEGLLDYIILNTYRTKVFLNLLSKGVYPGPQSHFENGTVISKDWEQEQIEAFVSWAKSKEKS